jgi:hypothetical protein
MLKAVIGKIPGFGRRRAWSKNPVATPVSTCYTLGIRIVVFGRTLFLFRDEGQANDFKPKFET